MILNHIFFFLTIFKIVIHRLFDFNSTYYLFKPIVFPKSTKTFVHIAWIRFNESRSFHTFVSFRFSRFAGWHSARCPRSGCSMGGPRKAWNIRYIK